MSIKTITNAYLDEAERFLYAPSHCEDCAFEAVLADEAGDEPIDVRDAATTRVIDGKNVLLCEEHDSLRDEIELLALTIALGLIEPMGVSA